MTCDVLIMLRLTKICMPSAWALGKDLLYYSALRSGICFPIQVCLCTKFMIVRIPISPQKKKQNFTQLTGQRVHARSYDLSPHTWHFSPILTACFRSTCGFVSPAAVSERRQYWFSCGMKCAYAYASSAGTRQDRKADIEVHVSHLKTAKFEGNQSGGKVAPNDRSAGWKRLRLLSQSNLSKFQLRALASHKGDHLLFWRGRSIRLMKQLTDHTL